MLSLKWLKPSVTNYDRSFFITSQYMILQILHELQTVNENTKEWPFGFPFSVKCRALVLAHIERLSIPEDTLQKGRCSLNFNLWDRVPSECLNEWNFMITALLHR